MGPYSDERRQSGPRPETYRPADRDRAPPPRRDSRDSRDWRHPNEYRGPREPRRENEPPRPPHIDTNLKNSDGPRRMSYNSPASARDKQGDDLHFKRANTEKTITQSTINSPLTPILPKAKNPELQDSFEAAYKWGEKFNKRILLGIRKNRITDESAQRRLEFEKFRAKAPSYAPYQSQSDKFSPADREVDDQLKAADEEYFRYLEQLIACVTVAAKPALAKQDPAFSALEAKVEHISEMVTKQAEQNQRLLDDNTNLRISISSLESANSDLRTKYDALKSDNAALQLKSCLVDEKTDALQSQQVTLESKIDSKTQDIRKMFEEKMTGLVRTLDSSEPKKETNDIIARLDAFTTDFNTMKDKLDELDMVTFNEICDAWVSTEYNMKTQYEEYIQRCSQGDSSWLKAVEPIIDVKIAAAEQAINNQNREFCEKRDNEYADLIDGASARITTLEAGAVKRSELEAHIQLLEEWKATRPTPQGQNQSLAERVARIESNKVSHRVDRIDLDVSNLSRKCESLQGEVSQLVKREWVDARVQELVQNVGIQGSAKDVRELQRKLGVLEHAILTLDSQYQNLNTKPLAEQIVRLVSPGLEERFGKLETKTSRLESKTNESDKTILDHSERFKALVTLLNSMVPSAKRTASPSQSEEPSKKRRLEVNGRHPSPLQQQLQNDPDRQS